MYTNKKVTNNKTKVKEEKVNNDIKPKFKFLPHIMKKNNEKLHCDNNVNNKKVNNNCDSQKFHLLKSPRNLLLITGKIEFCLNIRKLYSNISILFGVYGNIVKITKGKYRFQHLILLRNEAGPVLQVIFYKLLPSPQLTIGQKVYCVGRFIGSSNQMQIYKIKNILVIPDDEVLNRIRNVCNFSLKKINAQLTM